jgi:hypothetical protein
MLSHQQQPMSKTSNQNKTILHLHQPNTNNNDNNKNYWTINVLRLQSETRTDFFFKKMSNINEQVFTMKSQLRNLVTTLSNETSSTSSTIDERQTNTRKAIDNARQQLSTLKRSFAQSLINESNIDVYCKKKR